MKFGKQSKQGVDRLFPKIKVKGQSQGHWQRVLILENLG